MLLINFEINIILTQSVICASSEGNRVATFAITDTKLDVPYVTLSTQDNIKLLPKLKSGFKFTINWSNYQSKVTVETRNQYLDYLIDPSFRRVNRCFVYHLKIMKNEKDT